MYTFCLVCTIDGLAVKEKIAEVMVHSCKVKWVNFLTCPNFPRGFIQFPDLLRLKYNFLHNNDTSYNTANPLIFSKFRGSNVSVQAYTVYYLSGACIDVTQSQQLLCHLQIIRALSSRQCSEHHWSIACLVHIVCLT